MHAARRIRGGFARNPRHARVPSFPLRHRVGPAQLLQPGKKPIWRKSSGFAHNLQSRDSDGRQGCPIFNPCRRPSGAAAFHRHRPRGKKLREIRVRAENGRQTCFVRIESSAPGQTPTRQRPCPWQDRNRSNTGEGVKPLIHPSGQDHGIISIESSDPNPVSRSTQRADATGSPEDSNPCDSPAFPVAWLPRERSGLPVRVDLQLDALIAHGRQRFPPKP